MADGVDARAAGASKHRGSPAHGNFIGIVVPVGIWMLTEVNVVRTGGRWPVDQTAGLLIAASLLTVFYSAGLGAIREQERAPEPTTT